MEIPVEVKKFRSERARDLIVLAELLEKINSDIKVYPIYEAAKQVEDFEYIPKLPDETVCDPNIWGYNINDLIIPFDEKPRNIHPKDVSSLELILSIELVADYRDFKKMVDPFKSLSFEVLIVGESKYWHKVRTGFHIDRNLDSELKSIESHPAYHVHFGGRRLGMEDDTFGSMLFLPSPRFMSYPMDFILGIEFIFNNFFPELKEKIDNDSTLNSIIQEHKNYFWKSFACSLANYWPGIVRCKVEWQSDLVLPQLIKKYDS